MTVGKLSQSPKWETLFAREIQVRYLTNFFTMKNETGPCKPSVSKDSITHETNSGEMAAKVMTRISLMTVSLYISLRAQCLFVCWQIKSNGCLNTYLSERQTL